MRDPQIVFDEAVAAAYGFDREALTVNQKGRMTPDQQAYVRTLTGRELRKRGRRAVGYVLMALLLAALPVDGAFRLVFFGLALMLVGSAIRALATVLRVREALARDVEAGKVGRAAGRAIKYQKAVSRFILFAGAGFHHFSDAEWAAFTDEQRYIIYYAPQSRRIVSAHRMHPDEPLPDAWKRHDD